MTRSLTSRPVSQEACRPNCAHKMRPLVSVADFLVVISAGFRRRAGVEQRPIVHCTLVVTGRRAGRRRLVSGVE